MPAKKKVARKAAKRGKGRPSIKTAAIETRIIEGLTNGTPLTVICGDGDMPSIRSVYNWMDNDEGFSAHIAHARQLGWDKIAVEALTIADTPIEGIEHTDTPDGARITRKDMLGHRKLQVETRLKLLAKWDSRRYGDLLRQELSGPDGGPIETKTKERDEAAQDAFAEKLAKAHKRLESK